MRAGLDRGAHGAGALWGWALRETGAMLPAPLARAGGTGRARLVALDGAGEPGPATGARRSLFALWRHGGAPGGRTVVLLSPDAVHRRHLVLPAAAAGDVTQAIRLRLDTLCPIPPGEASFAVAPRGRAGDGGLAVEIAIARNADLVLARDIAREKGADWTVAADFAESGAELVFERGKPEGWPSRWLMAALALAGLVAAYLAVDGRLSRDIDAFETARADLLAEARTLQSRDAGAASRRMAEYPALADVLAASVEAQSGSSGTVSELSVTQRDGVIAFEDGGAQGFDVSEPGS